MMVGQSKITAFFSRAASSDAVELTSEGVDSDATEIDDEYVEDTSNDVTIVASVAKRKTNDEAELLPVTKKKAVVSGDRCLSQGQLWTALYRPQSTLEVIGNAQAVSIFRDWLATWAATFGVEDADNRTITNKCAFIYGPSGVGKTTLVHAAAADLQYQILEYSCTMHRLAASFIDNDINESLHSHALKSSRLSTRSLVLLDDLDAVLYETPPVNLVELWRALKRLITSARKPIVITSSLIPTFLSHDVLQYCKLVKLHPLGRSQLCQHLQRIYSREGLGSNPASPRLTMPDGDVRRMINEAQFWSLNSGDEPKQQEEEDIDLMLQHLNLLSLEDVHQSGLHRCWLKSEGGYNSHLYDRRMSLLSVEVPHPTTVDDTTASAISHLLSEYYQPATLDHFAFFFALTKIYPNAVAEVKQLFNSRREPYRTGTLRRSKRNATKLSFGGGFL